MSGHELRPYAKAQRCELAKLILERALEHIARIGVTVCINRPPGCSVPLRPEQLRYRHPDEST